MAHRAGEDRPLRVAIVGLGPKGLFALERLLDHAQRTAPDASLQIDLFEPHPVPGAGPVYDPGQPAFLRMNFAADQVDLWGHESAAVPPAQRRDFVEWWPGTERYPPRAHVGRYLADALERMRRRPPPGVTIALRPVRVRAARMRGCSWTLEAAGQSARDYDEVLVAVGHRPGGDAWPPGPWEHAAPLIPAVFPVSTRLSHDHVPAGAVVAVRGFALTFLDAALALTEGRGGAFEREDHPYRLRYVPSAHDAGLILPFSRTGRPMLAKPDPQLAAGITGLEQVACSAREQILALPPAFDLEDDLMRILTVAVGAGLRAAGGRGDGEAAARWLAAACTGAAVVATEAPARELERSLAVGSGDRTPDLQWALGHTWRAVYPAVVQRLGGAGLPAHGWPAFRRLAAAMERVAFGPPPVNAAKLLALMEAGRVDLTRVRGAQLETRDGITALRDADGSRAVDVVVNGVLAPPGALGSPGELLEQLVGDGHARILDGRRGLDVAADAGCVGRDGRRTSGLAVVGRATEDSVIGNDTLSRTLHPQADRWAERVALRAAGTAVVQAA